MIPATQIRVGQFLKINGTVYRVLKIQHITPGKGNAVVQTELRNLKTQNKENIRFRSAEDVEIADVSTCNMNFLYQDGEIFYFMDPSSYEQVEIPQSILGEDAKYLVPETTVTVSSYESFPINVTFPAKMTFEVIECDPPTKGFVGATKEAKLSNDILVKVPLFIKVGDKIVVSTETGDYLEKG